MVPAYLLQLGFLNSLMYFYFIEPPRDSLLWIHPLSVLFYRSLVLNNPSGILAVMQPNLGTHVFHIEAICSAGLILWACVQKKKPTPSVLHSCWIFIMTASLINLSVCPLRLLQLQR